MENTLLRFVNDGLRESSLALLDQFGMKYTLGAALPVSIRDLCKNISLSKAADSALNAVTSTYFVAQIDQRTFDNNPASVAVDIALAEANQEKYNGMFVFAVDINAKTNVTRTLAATLTRVFNRLASNKPVVLFIRQKDMLSISTCERSDYAQQWRSGEKMGKVSILRDINCKKPHRGHLNLLSRMTCHAVNFDDLYKKWMETFDVKLLSKKFYNELFEWYQWAMQLVGNNIVYFPAYPKDGYGKESKDETIIRIITRMLFVWFIKEKGLIPEKLFKVKEIKSVVKDFDPKSLNTHNYYNAILQNLFFATLNCEKEERSFIPKNNADGTNSGYGVNSLYRGADLLNVGETEFMSLFESIPYLNGGLFERLDTKGNYYDGFSNESDRRAVVPDALFFSEVDNGHCGLIKLFENYVFTIEENTPLEQSVSLDPELLGRVFENLLGAYNPETGTNARNESGSFYTPREIVEYMVNESLVQHLKECGVDEGLVHSLLEYKESDAPDISVEQRNVIMEALLHIKILDPACGSGAFPMGMLQQMVHVLRQIDPDNFEWKKLLKKVAGQLADKAYNETENKEERQQRLDEIERAFNLRYANPDYARKLFIIQNCIYGIDIQPIAIQISKLRFFISLICEQANNNILPLPNLETKFVCANTLIGINKGTELVSEELEAKERELLEVRKQHFYARTAKDKKKYRKEDDRLRTEMEKMIENLEGFNTGEAKQLVAWNPYDQNASSPFFDAGWMFGVSESFDIVIGNPPYISYYSNTGISLSEEERAFFARHYSTVKKANDRINSMNLMIEKGIRLLSEKGHLSFIVNKTVAVLPAYLAVRDFLLNNTQIVYFVPDLSPFAAIVDCVILGIMNKKTNSVYRSRLIHDNLLEFRSFSIDEFRNNRLKEFKSSEDLSLLEKIKSTNHKLDEYLEINRGVNIGGCFNDFLSSNPIDETYRKYLPGTANVKKYVFHWDESDGYMKLDKELERRLKQNGKTIALGDPSRYEKDRLIIPESSQTITAAFCNEKYYSGYGLMIGTLKNNDNSIKYLCALLNSNVITYYAVETEILRKGKKATPHVGTKGLQVLPIPPFTNNQQSIIDIVDQILADKKKDPQADTTTLERKIDILVYLLYGLTYDEVMVVENASQGEKFNLDKATYDKWQARYTKDGTLPSEEKMEKAVK